MHIKNYDEVSDKLAFYAELVKVHRTFVKDYIFVIVLGKEMKLKYRDAFTYFNGPHR